MIIIMILIIILVLVIALMLLSRSPGSARAEARVEPRAELRAGEAAAGPPVSTPRQPKTGHSTRAPPTLELLYSAGEADVPRQVRELLLEADAADGGRAAVGRSHQARLFEAWLPDAAQRTKISRKAFEVFRGSHLSNTTCLI